MDPFFPPRPKLTVFWAFLAEYEGQGWVAQRKFNGQRTLVHVDPAGSIELWSRHEGQNFQHKNYELTDAQKESIGQLALPKTHVVLDGELLHRKTAALSADVPANWRLGCRDTIVLFDLLYLDNYLAHISQRDRLAKLYDICGKPQQKEPGQRALIVHNRLWLAETFPANFVEHFKDLDGCPEIEGVVLRKLDSKLSQGNPSCGRYKHEVPWLIRSRRPKKNYHY